MPSGSHPSSSPSRDLAVAGLRLISALGLLATGAIHLEQYLVADYRVVPTIGPLFLFNFIAGTVLGLYFLIPSRRPASRVRWLVDACAAVGGWFVAAGALVALLISEHTPLFGFMEHGYRLEILIALVAESVAIVALAAFLGLSYHGSGGQHRTRDDRSGPIAASARPATERQ